jgi:predicted membrane-bound spermidine synthase
VLRPRPNSAQSLLILCAALSGASALTFELLWGRELALAFGSSQYAVATVLAAFMLGLGLGSFLGGRLADRVAAPAGVAARIELALVIGGPLWSLGLLRLPALAAAILPEAGDATRPAFLIGRLLVGVAVLMLPTMLMGAGFPLLARAAASSVPELHRGIGRLVAGATLGGVAGVIATGFVVLPRAGVPGAAAFAAAANLGAALAALAAQRALAGREPRREAALVPPLELDRSAVALLAAAAVSGGLVLAAETVWHRALLMVMANSTATLTLLLAVTLAGLAAGAVASSRLLGRGQPLAWWARLQAAAALLLLGQALLLPRIALAARLVRPDTGWARVLVPPLLLGGSVILPVAILLGAAWPLLLAAATPHVADGGRRLGAMGVVNSIGAALGATAAGFVALPGLGFGRCLVLLAACHAALAAVGARRRQPALALPVAIAGGLLAVGALAAPRFAAVALPSMVGDPEARILSYRESASGTVVVTEDRETGVRSMFVDNNAVIGSTYDALKVVRMLGLVPGLLHPRPERVLVIGYGAGVTTATIAAVPGVQDIEVAEIVPEVIEAARFFEHLNHDVLRDPRVRVVANDGRNHLLLGGPQYDVITCDPVHPLFGSAPLYSLDYFNLCRRRLRPGGIVCQYLPLHRMPTREFQRAIATFDAAFAESWVLFGLGHAMLVGSERPLELDWLHWQRVLEGHGWPEDLADSALATPAQIAALLQLDPGACRQLALGPPSTDLHPRLEFLAPAAYRPGLWAANARLLVDGYRSPLERVRGLPPPLAEAVRSLVAGKRLLLFSLLERDAGSVDGAVHWLSLALQVAGDDPEIQRYARQLSAELSAAR